MAEESPEELYEKLILHYQRWFSNSKHVVDAKIRALMESEGLSWEEAVTRLWESVERGYAYAYTSPRIGVGEAFSLGINRVKSSPALFAPVLLGYSAYTLFAAVFVVIGTIYVALTGNAIEITSTETLYAGFTPGNVLLILALGLEYFVFDSLGAALRGSYIYAMARNALNGLKARLEDVAEEARRGFRRVFATSLLRNCIIYGPIFSAAVLFSSRVLGPESPESTSMLTLLLILYTILARIPLAFVLPSAVIRGESPVRALIDGLKLALKSILSLIGFFLVLLLYYVIAQLLLTVFFLLHPVLGFFFVLPASALIDSVSDVALTALYMDRSGLKVDRGYHREVLSTKYLKRVLRRGFEEVRDSVSKPVYLAASLAVLLLGILGGLYLAWTSKGIIFLLGNPSCPTCGCCSPPSVTLLPSFSLNILPFDWSTGLSTCVLSLLTPLIPPLVLFACGIKMGVIAALYTEEHLYAYVLPGKCLGILGIVVAASAGLKLARSLRESRYKVEVLKRAVTVVVSLSLIFLLAAIVEAVVTLTVSPEYPTLLVT